MDSSWSKVIADTVDDFVSVRSVITLGTFGTMFFLVITGRQVDDNVKQIAAMLLTFWFATKVSSNGSSGNGSTNGASLSAKAPVDSTAPKQ